MCFMEPFHEVLSTLTESEVQILTPESWSSHHPHLDSPYYTEYLPLLRPEGGVLNFEDDFSYRNYFENRAHLASQQAYLDLLCELAATNSRMPVLGFCRSTGRVSWLRKRFPTAFHVLVVRGPLDQWSSQYEQYVRYGNSYFLNTNLRILSFGQGDFIRKFRERFALPDSIQNNEGQALGAPGHPVNELLWSLAFFMLYLLSIAYALPHVDLVIDIDALSSSKLSALYVSQVIRHSTGVHVDLRDAKSPRHPTPIGTLRKTLSHSIDEIVEFADGNRNLLFTDGISLGSYSRARSRLARVSRQLRSGT